MEGVLVVMSKQVKRWPSGWGEKRGEDLCSVRSGWFIGGRTGWWWVPNGFSLVGAAGYGSVRFEQSRLTGTLKGFNIQIFKRPPVFRRGDGGVVVSDTGREGSGV
eukprot:747783-Hanusia_phi.AAC.2